MARKLRVEYPGAVYHVLNRGDRREPIFCDDADRQRFISTLEEACAKTDWQVHYGTERQETMEEHAEGVVAEELNVGVGQRENWVDGPRESHTRWRLRCGCARKLR
jgi:hypothetical protein